MVAEDVFKEIEMHRDGFRAIALDRIREWMRAKDIGVQAQAADLLTYPPHCERVEPAASEAELEELLFPYYRRCLIEDPDIDLADSRYGMAGALVGWFSAVPVGEDLSEQTFPLHLKELLSSLYLESDEEIRGAIVHGFLEHVLEEPRWRPFFEDWRSDPVLRPAYEEAMAWAVEHER